MIPKELLKALRTIEIHTARLANEQLAGTYTSVFKGQGLAFREVRQYQPGDDVRSIDWNVSARMNEPFVKVFVEEREMTVDARRRSLGERAVRHAARDQGARGRRDRRALRVQRHQEQRPRRAHPRDRPSREGRPAQEGGQARHARDPGDPRLHARAHGHGSRSSLLETLSKVARSAERGLRVQRLLRDRLRASARARVGQARRHPGHARRSARRGAPRRRPRDVRGLGDGRGGGGRHR